MMLDAFCAGRSQRPVMTPSAPSLPTEQFGQGKPMTSFEPGPPSWTALLASTTRMLSMWQSPKCRITQHKPAGGDAKLPMR